MQLRDWREHCSPIHISFRGDRGSQFGPHFVTGPGYQSENFRLLSAYRDTGQGFSRNRFLKPEIHTDLARIPVAQSDIGAGHHIIATQICSKGSQGISGVAVFFFQAEIKLGPSNGLLRNDSHFLSAAQFGRSIWVIAVDNQSASRPEERFLNPSTAMEERKFVVLDGAQCRGNLSLVTVR